MTSEQCTSFLNNHNCMLLNTGKRRAVILIVDGDSVFYGSTVEQAVFNAMERMANPNYEGEMHDQIPGTEP